MDFESLRDKTFLVQKHMSEPMQWLYTRECMESCMANRGTQGCWNIPWMRIHQIKEPLHGTTIACCGESQNGLAGQGAVVKLNAQLCYIKSTTLFFKQQYCP